MQRTITIHQYLPNFLFYLIIKLLEALKLGTVIYSRTESQLYGFCVVARAPHKSVFKCNVCTYFKHTHDEKKNQ